jgi:hypothetical protein
VSSQLVKLVLQSSWWTFIHIICPSETSVYHLPAAANRTELHWNMDFFEKKLRFCSKFLWSKASPLRKKKRMMSIFSTNCRFMFLLFIYILCSIEIVTSMDAAEDSSASSSESGGTCEDLKPALKTLYSLTYTHTHTQEMKQFQLWIHLLHRMWLL